MLCPNCGAEVEEGRPDCPKCLNPVPKPGLLKRMWNALTSSSSGTTRTVIVPGIHKEFVVLRKERKVPLDKLPPELRSKLQEALDQGKVVSRTATIKVAGKDGELHSYHSLDEMPPEDRALFEKVWPELQAEMQSLMEETLQQAIADTSEAKSKEG